MISENYLESSPEIESRLIKKATKHGEVARDLSQEFKENNHKVGRAL